ncbi:MAG: VOC family protein [Pseudomonadota bacterium]
MDRVITNILTADPAAAADFYGALLGMTRHFTSDWFVILTHSDMPGLEYGLLQRDHAIVPDAARGAPGGVMVTFVVADCDAVHAQAQTMGADIVAPPEDMPYGQRRMILRDPDGTILDISAPTAPRPG